MTTPDFRPTEHTMPLLRETATTAAERARAESHVHRIGARHGCTPDEIGEVLAALGLARTEPRRATWPGMTDDTTRYTPEESR